MKYYNASYHYLYIFIFFLLIGRRRIWFNHRPGWWPEQGGPGRTVPHTWNIIINNDHGMELIKEGDRSGEWGHTHIYMNE